MGITDEDDSAVADGRTYVHKHCGGATVITEEDFAAICDPFSPVLSTYCAACEAFVSLSRVYWQDTGEPIADYRRRLRRHAPIWLKAWRYVLGPLALPLIVGVIALPLAWGDLEAMPAVIGGMCGAFAVGLFLLRPVTRWLFHVDFRREK